MDLNELEKSQLVHLLRKSQTLLVSDEREENQLLHDLQVHQIEVELQNRALREAQQELEVARDRYAYLYDFAPVGYLTLDRRGVITEANLTAAALLRVPRQALIRHPFSTFVVKESKAVFYRHLKASYAQGKSNIVTEIQIQPRKGEPMQLRLESNAWVKEQEDSNCYTVLVDITEHKKQEERQQFLMRELDHRTKNTMAIVQSISDQTLCTAASPDDFTNAFRGRIQALARVHEILAARKWAGVDLGELVERILEPYVGMAQLAIAGEARMLVVDAVQPIAMALHELATNAAKFGALSAPRGRVAVQWETQPESEAACLTLLWTESGGPPVTESIRAGLGSRLIQDGLRYGLNADSTIDYVGDGVRCKMVFPKMVLQDGAYGHETR